MFKVSASQSDSGRPYFITVRAEFETREAATAVAAVFPKTLLVGVGTCAYSDRVAYSVGLVVNLQPTKGNDRNEGGIKRYRSFLKHAAKNGFTIEHEMPARRNMSAFMTEAELEAAIS